MATFALSVLAALSAAVLVQAERTANRAVIVAAKPLTTLTLIAIAAIAVPAVPGAYAKLVVTGLACSLVGDVLLIRPDRAFLPALAAFLVAHLAYGAAFVGRAAPAGIAPFLPFAVAAVFVVRLVWPHVGRLRFAVASYAVAIAAMAGAALSAATTEATVGSWLAVAGASLFVLSDAALAVDRFVGRLPAARVIILSTYYPAQWLIALSVGIG